MVDVEYTQKTSITFVWNENPIDLLEWTILKWYALADVCDFQMVKDVQTRSSRN
jgi:hypothetical protein